MVRGEAWSGGFGAVRCYMAGRVWRGWWGDVRFNLVGFGRHGSVRQVRWGEIRSGGASYGLV